MTAVIIKAVDPADWFAGGKSLAEQKLASYWIDTHVSEGTNTKDEKAAYLAAMFARMGELLGPLHEETYLHVDEVKGDAYGFGGLARSGATSPASSKWRRSARRRELALRAGFSRFRQAGACAGPNTSSNACCSATSTSAIVTGWPRSTSEVTP